MKTFSALALGVLFTLGLAPHLNAAPQFGRERSQDRDRVCFYQDIQYHGWEQCYSAGDEIASLRDHNRAASSMRIYGRARVMVYEDTEFRGRSAEFTSDVPDLGRRSVGGSNTWNDRIQSIRVSSDNNGNTGIFGRESSRRDDRNDRNDRSDNPVNEGICVYDHADFQGREQCWGAGENISDLARSGNWSDRISSVRVFGGAAAIVYRDIGFRGASMTIDRDIPNLASYSGQGFRNWDRQISSIQIENTRNGFPGRGRARGRFWR